MFDSFKETWAHRSEIMTDVQTVGFKQALTNAKAKVSMTALGAELIGIVILCVIIAICPVICDAIVKALPNTTSNWGDVTANSLFTTLVPMVSVCAIVILAGLVIKVIYDIRNK